jgi:uridylate kinase
MDASSIALARDNNLPIVVFSLFETTSFLSIVEGKGKFSLVS